MAKKPSSGRPQDDLELAREVITRMGMDVAWDQIKARDIDPAIIDYVQKELARGIHAGAIAKSLGFRHGTSDRRWGKIQAHFRMGFRADAEAYLYLQSKRLFRVVEDARKILEDAMKNGVPIVVTSGGGKDPISTEVIQVKGATKELATFMKAYSDVLAKPVELWKTFGAIGEKKDAGSSGVTIIVENNIPMPSEKEIEAGREITKARANAIEVKPRPV